MKKIANHKSKIGNAPAFTLVELLTVIAIIGILAAMLLPVLTAAKTAAKKNQAKTEMSSLVTAIEAYDQDYSRFPLTSAEQTAVGTNDFTTGYIANPQANVTWPPGSTTGYSYNVSGYSYDNSNTIAILMDLQTFPNGTPTVENGHVYNPKQVKYLNAKMSGDPTLPGVGPDNVYRDPWGNPYIITMNSSYNEQGTSDLYYSQQNVSQNPPAGNSQSGFNGLFNPVDANGAGNHFLSHNKVMVWSAGPDGKIDDASGGSKPANQGFNKDNVLSWQ